MKKIKICSPKFNIKDIKSKRTGTYTHMSSSYNEDYKKVTVCCYCCECNPCCCGLI